MSSCWEAKWSKHGKRCRSRDRPFAWPQGVWLGIGLSVVAMLAASAGYLPPLVGAFLQEGIDVLVIVNALRATRGVLSWA